MENINPQDLSSIIAAVAAELTKMEAEKGNQTEVGLVSSVLGNVADIGNQAVDVVDGLLTGVTGLLRGVVNLVTFQAPRK